MGPPLFASYIEIEYMRRMQHMVTGSRLLHANGD
jgi:hypothetical protein